jgi:hypothetical protein
MRHGIRGGLAVVDLTSLGQSVKPPKRLICKAAVRHATFHNLPQSKSTCL